MFYTDVIQYSYPYQYHTQALRNKAFGSALDFVWGEGSGDYAIRESISRYVWCMLYEFVCAFLSGYK
ncbi:hypothetical protein EON63_23395 [archaeon]|nr:MAG: hypothetical protein EON63_23395 [archaeon]